MTFSAQTRLVILSLSTLVIGACTANTTADTSLRGRVASYLDANISDLSPRTATEGKFTVKDIQLADDNTVRVTYEDDAGVELHGIGTVDENGTDLVTNFRIDTSFRSSSSSLSSDDEDSSTSSDGSSLSTMNDNSSSSETDASSSVMMDSSLSAFLSY